MMSPNSNTTPEFACRKPNRVSNPSESTSILPGDGPRPVPEWYPAWAREFAAQYFAGTTCVFVLHGNVHDLMPIGPPPDAPFGTLNDFLATSLLGSWDVVLRYDLSQGLRAYAASNGDRLRKMVALLEPRLGDLKTWPRDPDAMLASLDALVKSIILDEDPSRRISLGLVIDHAQFLVPSAELATMTGALGTRLVRLLSWAQNPYIKRHNVAICLLADRLAEINERLAGSAHVAKIAIPLPELQTREAFVSWYDQRDGQLGNLTEFTAQQLAELTSGLSLVSLDRLLSSAGQSGKSLDGGRLKALKKDLIESQALGLVEFIEPPHSLDDFVGNDAVKQRLADDARLLSQGRLDAAPMGYLVCGTVGTGKTYLAECFAGSVGIPCVKLRNFRSKYVGETEGNLEQLLNVLRAMGPVLIVIDEADAALGTREASGDSGTSSRVFSMIASQMGDTRYRGKLIWMLLTSRPDLLPIDLKRQGRAEVHLPLFPPRDEEEVRYMVKVMARKNKTKLAPDAVPNDIAQRGLSGADLESIVIGAKRFALLDQRETIERADLDHALSDFIPSAQGLEKEKQELAAVLECTSLSYLPESWRKRVSAPDGRVKLQERMSAIRQLIED